MEYIVAIDNILESNNLTTAERVHLLARRTGLDKDHQISTADEWVEREVRRTRFMKSAVSQFGSPDLENSISAITKLMSDPKIAEFMVSLETAQVDWSKVRTLWEQAFKKS